METLLDRVQKEIDKIMDVYKQKKENLDYIGQGIWTDEQGRFYHVISGKPYPIVEFK